MKVHPVITIIAGISVTIICLGFLEVVTGIVTSINISAHTPFGITNVVVGATSILIGGFVSTFFAREKKIRYGIYVWIIYIIFVILTVLYVKTQGIHPNYYNIICTSTVYLLAAAVGSYLGKAAGEHLKQKSEKAVV